ncbi:MAG: YggS family pyridoxal phosphate-dependent enzyme, partial [Gemmatimonadales bacterium]
MSFEHLPANLARVRDEIAGIQAREGLKGEIRIVAVTKGQPVAAARAAVDAGLSDVGENRVQEAIRKQDELAGLPVRWHLIGHLQTNKAKYVPQRFAMVHSVDSARVAEALAHHMERRAPGEVLPVLVQVNVAGEEQKSGCEPDRAQDVAQAICAREELELEGLMTMAPYTDDESLQRRVFAAMRRLREDLTRAGLSVPELSMGMSGDYRAAVAEGATILRL